MNVSISRRPLPALGVCLALAVSAAPSIALADSDPSTGPLPDTHGPAGVMFDHMHKKGEWMFGFRYMYSSESGDILHGGSKAGDQMIVDRGLRSDAQMLDGSE